MSIAFTPVPQNRELLLNGDWQIKRYPFEESLAASPENNSDWETISQPGKIFYSDPEAEGDDIPDFDRVSLAHIDPNDGAVCVRKIIIPAAWHGKVIKLRFNAIYPGGIIYVNGNKLGEHFSGLTPFESDITDIVHSGEEAVISIRLYRTHKFVKMDMPRHSLEFAGLAQDACLFATDHTHIADYHLISELSDDYTTGTISGSVTIANPVNGELIVDINNGNVQKIKTTAEQNEYKIKLTVIKPKLWNDEYPNLYTVSMRLGEQVYSYRTGFRCFKLALDGAKLNGNFIKFRGVNHLTFHPELGLYTPKEWLRQNLSLMKKANVNAIRTHYPGTSDFIDLCDEMGFYLLQEIPIDWGTNYIHDNEWVAPALFRIESIIRRDRHHPSVMVWSVGNENMPQTKDTAEAGWQHLQNYDKFCHELDPSRPTMFPPPGPANAIEGIFEIRLGEIADTHYSFKLQKQFNKTGCISNPNSWEADMIGYTREWALKRGWSGCWFSSEYGLFNAEPDLLHAPYLSIIADDAPDIFSGENTLETFHRRLKSEWGNMRHDPTCLGGAYFPWLCAGAADIPEHNTWGWTRWGEDANWGVITAGLLPKPQFWSMRVLFAPLWFPDRVSWKVGDEHISFEIQNQYNSINLSECTFRVQQNSGSIWMSLIRKFKDIKIAAEPGEKVTAKIPIWNNELKEALGNNNFGYCRITVLDPFGFCPVKADILIIPEAMQLKDTNGMPIGPDAIMETK